MKAAVPGFVGNCEGTDLTSGNFDVVVADGMSGNIALKATEGAAKFLLQELKGAFMASLGTKIAALLIKKQMREIKAKLSGDAKGGAILLGLRGVVLIGHGATSVEAVKTVRLRRPKPCAPAGRECRQLHGRHRFITAALCVSGRASWGRIRTVSWYRPGGTIFGIHAL